MRPSGLAQRQKAGKWHLARKGSQLQGAITQGIELGWDLAFGDSLLGLGVFKVWEPVFYVSCVGPLKT